MSAALALLADTSLILLGGSLKRRERISARLGDIMSQLYLASSVLKYFHDHHEPESDVDYVTWAMQQCLYKIQIACDELFSNFPNRVVGKLLKWIIFPWGVAYRNPKDIVHKHIVAPMLKPSELRDRLTQHCYISDQENDLSYRLEKALTQVSDVDPLFKKLHKAVQQGNIPKWADFDERVKDAFEKNILTANEVVLLKEYEILRKEIVKVNEFSFQLDQVIA